MQLNFKTYLSEIGTGYRFHYAEFKTTYKITGRPKLVGSVQFEAPVTPEGLEAISPDITWVNQRGANVIAISFIERVGAERSNTVNR